MNLKFCEKVLLLFNTDCSISHVKIFPPHRKKEAEKERLSSRYKETHLIEVSNSNFRVKFWDFQTKYYGASVRLELDHPEFKDYPPLNEGEHSLVVSTDTFGFSEIIMKSGLDHGFSYDKTFSFDLYTNSWYHECYRLVPDNSSFIPERVSNYREFWESPKVSSMKLGSVYLDRWGDIYLALTDKVYSRIIGTGYSGDCGHYSPYYSWGTVHNPDEKRPATVLAYLGDSKDILEYLPEIGKDCSSLKKFFEDLFQRTENHLSEFSIGTDFLRIKGYSNGHFVKLMEIPGYESLYKSMSGWKGLKEILFNLSDRYSLDNCQNDCISHLEYYFYVTSEKEVRDHGKILSSNEKSIYRKYILNIIKSWKTNSTILESEKYPRFYTPKKYDEKFTLIEINDFLNWKVRKSFFKAGVRDYWCSAETFINLGVFKDGNDFINEFEKIRRS